MSSCANKAPRGIDITAKAEDIRRLVLAKYRGDALDRDDLVQEVLFAIHRKNGSERSAYDPTRAAFSTYVYRVASGIISHMLEAPRWRREAAAEAASDVVDEELAPLDVMEAAAEAGINVEASRELGELVPLRPRQLWEIALEERQRPPAPPPPPARPTVATRRRLAEHRALVASLRASLVAHYDRPPVLAPLPRRRMRGLVSWFYNDVAEHAAGPLAGHEPSGIAEVR